MSDTNRRHRGVVIGIVVVAAAVAFAAEQPAAPPSPGYGLQVHITRDLQASTFQLTGAVTDLASGRELWAPRITGELGREVEARSTVGEGADSLRITLTVRVDEHAARYELLVSRGDQVLSRQSASISEKLL